MSSWARRTRPGARCFRGRKGWWQGGEPRPPATLAKRPRHRLLPVVGPCGVSPADPKRDQWRTTAQIIRFAPFAAVRDILMMWSCKRQPMIFIWGRKGVRSAGRDLWGVDRPKYSVAGRLGKGCLEGRIQSCVGGHHPAGPESVVSPGPDAWGRNRQNHIGSQVSS